METINIQQKKIFDLILDLEEDILVLQKLQKKLNLQKIWGQEIGRVISEEISLMQWQKSEHIETMRQDSHLQNTEMYTPSQPPQKDVFSANIEKEIRERFVRLTKDEKKSAESLV